MDQRKRIIVPIDTSDINEAIRVVEILKPEVGMFKFGLEFTNSIISQLILTTDPADFVKKVRYLFSLVEGQLFWDGKWDDIPNTTKGVALAIAPLNPKIVNVHASSGNNSIKAAVENSPNSLVFGVTVLTSLSIEDCIDVFGDLPDKTVLRFAKKLVGNGAHGIICSPKELLLLKDFSLIKITPGVRPTWASKDDQKRVMTPREAVRDGADFLVIGRPITNPPPEIGSPVDAARRIVEEIGG